MRKSRRIISILRFEKNPSFFILGFNLIIYIKYIENGNRFEFIDLDFLFLKVMKTVIRGKLFKVYCFG